MRQTLHAIIPNLIEKHHQRLADAWLAIQKRDGVVGGQITDGQLAEQSRRFLVEFRKGVVMGLFDDISGPEWDLTRDLLDTVAGERAVQGFSPSETAVFVLSLKEPLFELLREEIEDVELLAREIWVASLLIDKLGLHTVEVYQKGREEVIRRQQEELLELSTPVVLLWDSILVLPLIGTLDRARTQTVMENMLERIVATRAEFAIIDITGVPTVDTLVAQKSHQDGFGCTVDGRGLHHKRHPAPNRPDDRPSRTRLDVVSKATMADAFALALGRLGKSIGTR